MTRVPCADAATKPSVCSMPPSIGWQPRSRRRLSVGKTISAMQQKTELVCGLVFVGESDRLLGLFALEPTEGLHRLHVCWRVIAAVWRRTLRIAWWVTQYEKKTVVSDSTKKRRALGESRRLECSLCLMNQTLCFSWRCG